MDPVPLSGWNKRGAVSKHRRDVRALHHRADEQQLDAVPAPPCSERNVRREAGIYSCSLTIRSVLIWRTGTNMLLLRLMVWVHHDISPQLLEPERPPVEHHQQTGYCKEKKHHQSRAPQ